MRLFLLLAYALTGLWIVLMADTGHVNPFLLAIHTAPLGDKVLHALFAGGLALLTNLVLLSRPGASWRSLLAGGLIVMAACAVEEASNLLTPYRACDLGDLMANNLGILLLGCAPLVIALHRRPVVGRS
jgi:VanZ family protein